MEQEVVKNTQGTPEQFSRDRLVRTLVWASGAQLDNIDLDLVMQEVVKNMFDSITPHEIADTLILAASAFIEIDPAYGFLASRLQFKKLYKAVTGYSVFDTEYDVRYRASFISCIMRGVGHKLLDERMKDFDLAYLADKLVLGQDDLFDYMGIKTLYERYFLRHEKEYLELPQAFWMRVAMGLAYNEPDKNEKAVLFYTIMSSFRYIPGTPTLLHGGLKRPQLSSCYLTTVEDDLHHIFKCYGDNAQLSKWSGGVANDWSNIRAVGAMVDSIKTQSQGLVPFLKIVSDTTAAINRSGKRRSATVVYLEVWHYEIEDFLDLRRNTGDERRRTHDINTAVWVPDLFVKRILADQDWTVFSPDEVPDLHRSYGKKFELLYEEYERKAAQGGIKLFNVMPAKQLWRKILSRLFETGHPWITFKDPCNIRSPQDHVGVVNSSNLCTEITLNTSADETAVCNLGSINVSMHIADGFIDQQLLAGTVNTAIRMLDNVIDINFYPTKEAKNANSKHRPVGLGLMGFQDMLYKMDICFDNPRALTLADELMEFISYHAIFASSELARERGTYESYAGSKWDRGIFPQDTLDLLEQERGVPIETVRGGILDWNPVRAQVKRYGMRNSNTMAIAPTATISNVVGCVPCIEPIYKNIYVKANMSGEFTVVNKYLVYDLKKLGLWNVQMLELLKYYDGNVQLIEEIPQHIKDKYKEAFELDPLWLIRVTAARGKWIDQSQSHNIFMKGVSGNLMHDIYITAWLTGLKTTYYPRTLAASQVEKSTLDAKKYGYTQKRLYMGAYETNGAEYKDIIETTPIMAQPVDTDQSCSLMNGSECEACQ